MYKSKISSLALSFCHVILIKDIFTSYSFIILSCHFSCFKVMENLKMVLCFLLIICSMVCGFIIICWIPIFVDFVVQGNHKFKCPTKYTFSKGMYAEFAKSTNLNIHEHARFNQSTKIGTHENK